AHATGSRVYRILGIASIANLVLVLIIGAVVFRPEQHPGRARGGVMDNLSQLATGALSRIGTPPSPSPAAGAPATAVEVAPARPRPVLVVPVVPVVIVHAPVAVGAPAVAAVRDAGVAPPVTPETTTPTLEM
ncbi:MAG: hypothetical protein WCJ30_20905, partial [Deltaproteobacteria bacterium]